MNVETTGSTQMTMRRNRLRLTLVAIGIAVGCIAAMPLPSNATDVETRLSTLERDVAELRESVMLMSSVSIGEPEVVGSEDRLAAVEEELAELRESVTLMGAVSIPMEEDVLVPPPMAGGDPLLPDEEWDGEDEGAVSDAPGYLVLVLLVAFPVLLFAVGLIGGGSQRRRWFAAGFLVLGLYAIMAAVGSNLGLLIDPPSFVIVVLGSFFLTLSTHRWSKIARAFHCAFASEPVAADEAHDARLVFRSMQNYAIGLGVLGFLIGLIIMLTHMDDPSAIGPGMAIALVTIVYAVALVALVITPLQIRVLKRRDGNGGDGDDLPGSQGV